MKEAGIREARQNLTALIEEVRHGHEVTIAVESVIVQNTDGADSGIHLDSSALAKLYVPEPERDRLDAFLRGRAQTPRGSAHRGSSIRDT